MSLRVEPASPRRPRPDGRPSPMGANPGEIDTQDGYMGLSEAFRRGSLIEQ